MSKKALLLLLSATVTTVSGCGGASSTTTETRTSAQPLIVNTNSLPSGTVGSPYAATLGSTGGTQPVGWTVSVGALPAGLNLNAATGHISGTPTTAGTYTFTMKATDSGSPAQNTTAALSITINPATPMGLSVGISPSIANVPAKGTANFTAVVVNDPGNKGVTWTLMQVGTACSPACGTIAPNSTDSGIPTTFSAPTTVPNPPSVTLIATSVSDPSKSASATATIVGITVFLVPSAATVAVNATRQFTATVTNDVTSSGVTWTLAQGGIACSPNCGTIAPSTTTSGTAANYTAPGTIPSPATVTAKSIADPSKSASATVTVTNLAAASAVSFIARRQFSTGGQPLAVVAADFNGDGIEDLVAANSSSNEISVLLGKGDGTFKDAMKFAAGTFPWSVAVGDFNGDRVMDIAVANRDSNSVSILLGNGDGTFRPAANFAVGVSPSSIAVGDFNKDGKPDLAVANTGAFPDQVGSVSILLGNGDGTFSAAPAIGVGRGPAAVVVADFNRDGFQDLAVAEQGYYQFDITSDDYIFVPGTTVSILLGTGPGTFRPPSTVSVGYAPSGLSISDFNLDGKLDLAVANRDSFNASVLLGNGDGTFQPSRTFDTGGSPVSVVTDDFNRDGKPDLLIANVSSDDVSLLLGNGDGTFQPQQRFGAGRYPSALAVGDFNRDGLKDIAVPSWAGGSVSVLLGRPDGSFRVAPRFTAGATYALSMAAGDLNLDGQNDLVVVSWDWSDTNVSVLLANADGSFQPPRKFASGGLPWAVAVADINMDGKPDVIVANQLSIGSGLGSVSILLGNGDGTLQAARTVTVGVEARAVAIGDFNGDHLPDLVVANWGSNNVSVLLGNGDGTFRSPQNYAVGAGPSSVVVGDFNRDGVQDLAVANRESNNISILLGNGDGSFRPAQNYGVAPGPLSLTVGDFNRDGLIDLVVAHANFPGVAVLLGNGDGTFQSPQYYTSGSSGLSVAVSDFDGDGIQDLVVTNGENYVSVLMGNPDGTFQFPQYFGVGTTPAAVVVSDFNRDGRPDFATANVNGGDVSIVINDTPKRFP